MNKIMVTGLAIGRDFGACKVCNFDLSWLIKNPSTLIWVDKIILTSFMWDLIKKGSSLGEYKHELVESIKLIFEKAKAENIIEIADPTEIITSETCSIIFKQIKNDVDVMAETFPGLVSVIPETPSENGKIKPEVLRIGNLEYCHSSLFSIYASLILSRMWKAQCLFEYSSFQFCKYRFGLVTHACDSQFNAFQNVFNSLIPNDDILPHIAITSEKTCNDCGRIMECRKTYKKELESSLDNIFKWRNYDEVQQIKIVLESIIKKTSQSQELINYQEIVSEYHKKERTIQKKIKKVFPKVKRYASLATLISIPFAVLGVATNTALLTVAGASVAGIALASQQVIDFMQSRFNWVSFIPNREQGDK